MAIVSNWTTAQAQQGYQGAIKALGKVQVTLAVTGALLHIQAVYIEKDKNFQSADVAKYMKEELRNNLKSSSVTQYVKDQKALARYLCIKFGRPDADEVNQFWNNVFAEGNTFTKSCNTVTQELTANGFDQIGKIRVEIGTAEEPKQPVVKEEKTAEPAVVADKETVGHKDAPTVKKTAQMLIAELMLLDSAADLELVKAAIETRLASLTTPREAVKQAA